ncbi:MAG: DMT family transporter, partial [Acidobacteriota bacterium]
FLLTVGAALGFTGLDVVRKLLADRIDLVPLLFAMTAGVVPIYLVWWQAVGGATAGEGYLLPAAGSVVLNVAANILFLRSVQIGGLAATIPMLSLTPVFTAIFGALLLRELPVGVQWLGIVLVVTGAFLLNLPGAGDEDADRMRGALMMVGVAVCWSLAPALDKLSIEASSPMFHGIVLQAGVAVLVLPILMRSGGWPRALGEHKWLLLAAIALSALAVALQLMAMERVFVGLLETTKRAIGSTAALAVGSLVFSDRTGLREWSAVAIMTAGVAVILL